MERAPLQAGRLPARRGTLHRDVAAARQFTAQRIKAGREHAAGALQIGVIHITGVSDCVPVVSVVLAPPIARWRDR